jgi:hypothetical protein
MPKAYGYSRASTGRQDLTFDSQKAAIERHFKDKLEPAGYTWGGLFEDKAVSGGKPFTERPEGRKLWVVSQPGDAVIWLKMDRAFRSVKDGSNVLSMFRDRGISIHSLDIGLDTSTPMGEFVAHLLIILAQLERSWISSRTKEALAALKARGYKRKGDSVPAGYKRVGQKGDTKIVPDHEERALMVMCFQRYMAGDSLDAISNWLFFSGKRRKRGSQYKPSWLAYAFRCNRTGWPRTLYYFEYEAALKEALKGRRLSKDRLRQLMQEEFGSGGVVNRTPQLGDAGHEDSLGPLGVAPILPAE